VTTVRVVYQVPATIIRFDGSDVCADVTVWVFDGGPQSEWGGRVTVTRPETLFNDGGATCGIRWTAPGGGVVVGAFVLCAGQLGGKTATYRVQGSGVLAEAAADD
jgi:hypothetical protein